MPQRVQPDRLADPGTAGYSADDPGGAVPVQPRPVKCEEDRSFHAFADGQVDRPRGTGRERDGDNFAALASNYQSAVTALDAQVLEVGASAGSLGAYVIGVLAGLGGQ